MIEAGELEASVPGKVRRRLRLSAVLAYRDQLRARRSDFIAESSAEFSNIDDDSDVVKDLLEEARRNAH